VVLLAGLGFVLLLLPVRARWAPLRRADQAVADGHGARPGPGVLTDLGGTPMLLWLVVRRQGRIALYVAVTALGAMGLNPLVKELVGRARPVVEEPLSAQSGMSFPSGHALGSTVSYGVLLLVFLPEVGRRTRPLLAEGTASAVLVVGLARMALGVHHLSDVLASVLPAGLWMTACWWVTRPDPRPPPEAPPSDRLAKAPGAR
jgi:undecaprenyl-diphosphatase